MPSFLISYPSGSENRGADHPYCCVLDSFLVSGSGKHVNGEAMCSASVVESAVTGLVLHLCLDMFKLTV